MVVTLLEPSAFILGSGFLGGVYNFSRTFSVLSERSAVTFAVAGADFVGRGWLASVFT